MNSKNSSSKTIRIMTKIIVYLLMIMILVVLGVKGFDFGAEVFSKQGTEESPGTDVVITIPEGADKSLVADILVSNNLITNKSTFSIQCLIHEAQFYAGEYTLNTSLSPEDIIEELKIAPSEQVSEGEE